MSSFRFLATQVVLKMYSTFTFIGDKIVEHVVARDYGAFLDQVATAVPCSARYSQMSQVNAGKADREKQLAEQTQAGRTANVSDTTA
jgi:hypothetical protein